MKRTLLAGLMALLFAAAPAAASVKSFSFTFAGNGIDNHATATGFITFDMALLLNPGRNVFDTSDGYVYTTGAHPYGPNIPGLVTALTVTVSDANYGNGTFNLFDFDGVLFDTSLKEGGVDLTRELTTQWTVGGFWGTNVNVDKSNPPRSSTGDFQLFSPVTSDAPSGGNPYTLGDMTLTSFAPAAVPEPTTYVLLCISLGVVGFARRKLVNGERRRVKSA